MTAVKSAERALAGCHDVSVVYGDEEAAVRALAGVSIEIDPDASVALLGRSGSGKTTLLHVLGGLVEPTSGAVEWHGRPLTSLDLAARGAVRSHGLAYVFQGANLLPTSLRMRTSPSPRSLQAAKVTSGSSPCIY